MKATHKLQSLRLLLMLLLLGGLAMAQTPQPPSVWDINGSGDSTIQGFASEFSVNLGEIVHFKVSTTAASWKLDIYRLGYYGGNGAALYTTINVSGAQSQPACLTNSATRLVDCGNWANSAQWAVPLTAKSGVYFAKATRNDNGGASHIYFVVRDDSSHADIVFQTSDTTWQAYNQYGGSSLYGATGTDSWNAALRAYKISYNRPITTRGWLSGTFLFDAEYPMIRFLEANGYDVTYISGRDSDQRGATLLANHKMFLSVGHDEYWSGAQRTNVEAARTAGVNLAFYSGNEMFWKIRWENSIDGTSTPYRTLVCYKETLANAKIDPTAAWTGTWRDPRFSPPADGGKPENAVMGTIFTVNGTNAGQTITVADTEGKMRFWRNTNIATLPAGGTTQLNGQVLSYEWDEDLDNGSRPAGVFPLSTSTYNVGSYLIDYGSTYAAGTATHHLNLYRAASGALVFGGGSMRLAWGLDANHDNSSAGAPVDQRFQQATVNLFADMGVQPTTLIGGLVAASKTTDTFAPTTTISSPLSGATLPAGTNVNIAGTATDSGGGVIAGVEVSADNGTTWHLASGRGSWSYSWVSNGANTTIKSRAIDDSGNIQTTPTAVTVNSGGGGGGGNKILGYSTIASQTDSGDTNSISATRWVMPNETGSATAMSVYIPSPIGTSPNNQYSMAIYADTNGLPGALIASTASATLSANAWNSIPISATLQPNTAYWLAYNANGGSTVNNMKYDTGTASQAAFRSQTFGTWPSSFGNTSGTASVKFSIYVLYSTSSDTTAPTTPTNLSATGSIGTASLTWTAATDNVGVVNYNVHRSTTSGFAPSAANRIAQPAGTSYSNTGLTAGTYYYLVTAQDAAGNVGPQSNQATATVTSDTQAPTAPSGLTASVTGSTANLSWIGSTDNVAVTKYDVYRSTTSGFTPSVANRIAQPTTTSYADASLAVGTYYYLVAAEDAAVNISGSSNQATAVIPDTVAPTAPTTLTATGNAAAGTASLTWTASTDNIGVVGYNVYRSTTSGFTPSAANLIAQPTTTGYGDSSLPNGIYYYIVKASDAAGNLSANSNQASVTLDNVAPTVPTNVQATAVGSTINLTWTASTDVTSGVANYRIYRGLAANSLAQVGTSTTASYSDPGLASNTTYFYAAAAVDGATNVSAQSTPPASTTTSALPPFKLGTITVGTIADSGYGNNMTGFRYTTGATQSGVVSSMSVYIPAPIGASPNNLFQVALYSDSAGNPGTLIASSASQTIAAAGWITVPISATLAANTSYWLVYNTNASAAANNSLILSSGGTMVWRTQTFGTWPASFGAVQGSAAYSSSMYASVN